MVMTRSECETCGRRLGPLELVPLLSYVALRGRCRTCRAPIGAFHPATELAACGVVLSAVLADPMQDVPTLWANFILGWFLLTLGWIDWRSGYLPDALSLPLLLTGLAATAALEPWQLADHALGAAAGYAVLRLVEAAYRALRGRDGVGRGDAKLLAACGAWVGWDGLAIVMLLAAFTGIALALVRSVATRTVLSGTMSVPFGPCLALAAWVVRLHLMLPGV